MDIGFMLNGASLGEWHKIGTSGAEVKMRGLRPSEKRKIFQKAQMKPMEKDKDNERQMDLQLLNDLLLECCIVDWKNIEKDDKPFPCTLENKKILDDFWPEFNRLWNSVYNNIIKEQEVILEADLKN